MKIHANLELTVAWVVVSAACWSWGGHVFAADVSATIERTFERDVRPILKVACFHCHGEEHGADWERPGGLDLRLVRLMAAGGDAGAAIVPGDVEASLLWQRIVSDEMPEGPKKLTAADKAVIREWIEQGAQTARAEPANVEDARYSLEELGHWAFQRVQRPTVPRPTGVVLTSPIDGFVAARLAESGLSFSPEADRTTLARRIYFALIGLPPTLSEIEQFVHDSSTDACERLVDRLLASPQFGVRWGRHWLDAAGYAESDGGELDTPRPHAWRYRDYVVDSLNANKPIDQFFREQLAGDELVSGELEPTNELQRELLTAVGFLRMAPDVTQGSNTLENRNLAAADAIKVVSSAMLGLTIGCAQCHDHKYDPISIDDYYRYRAIFDPVFPLHDWETPGGRVVDFTTDDVRAEADRIELVAKQMEDDLKRRRDATAREIQLRKLADVPEQDRQATEVAVLTPDGERTESHKVLLDQYPMVKPISTIVGLLVEYDAPSYRKFEKELEEIAAVRATKPAMRVVMTTRERTGVVPTSRVFFRGNPETPGKEVDPAELFVIARQHAIDPIPHQQETPGSTGRRIAYARHLTSGSHPLTARVFVNRIWMHLMGRGIVATPGDFGLSGERPTHPELLDWLADDFVTNGWDMKRLIKQITLSTTYRQCSQRTAKQDAIDPENELLGRMNLRRLEAEELRDAILSASGKLLPDVGGPSVPITESPEGKVVIGTQKIRDGLRAGVAPVDAGAYRRSAFVEVRRKLPLEMLGAFDQPIMNPNCEVRRSSTVATQSLWFLNSSEMVERADELASRLVAGGEALDRYSDVETSDTIDVGWLSRCVDALFLSLFAEPPSDGQRVECVTFVRTHFEQARPGNGGEGEEAAAETQAAAETRLRQALSALCQTLLASNRFLYID